MLIKGLSEEYTPFSTVMMQHDIDWFNFENSKYLLKIRRLDVTYLQDNVMNRAAMSIKHCQNQPYLINTVDQDLESYSARVFGGATF